jgi:hypothetical protein
LDTTELLPLSIEGASRARRYSHRYFIWRRCAPADDFSCVSKYPPRFSEPALMSQAQLKTCSLITPVDGMSSYLALHRFEEIY